MIPATHLHCVRTPAAIVSRISDERLAAELGPVPPQPVLQAQQTGTRDRIAYPAASSVWFQGHAGGAGNGEYAEYDPQSQLLARCVNSDTAQIVQVTLAAAAPAYVPRGSFTFATRRGLRIGSPAWQVQRVYGTLRPAQTPQGQVYAYERSVSVAGSSLPFRVRTIFFVRNARVTGIVRIEGY